MTHFPGKRLPRSRPGNTTGRTDEYGTAFEPRDFHAHHLDPAAAVPALVKRFSGPQARIGH
ncbi:hypothetical protein ABZ471_20615 [Streptomyces sp. NPDC005728]|uniref:hypothetical protein n=1 Tax=Streptomyces sp. NPDC005728 TaxID=3157054 RepID=UPI0033FF404B